MYASRLAILALALAPLTLPAQSDPAPSEPSATQSAEPPAGTTDCGRLPTRALVADCTRKYYQTRNVVLANAINQNEANEILVAVRNAFDPSLKVYLIASQHTLVLGSYPEDLNRIEAFIHSLDKPHKLYRLTFTIAESDAGKRTGVEHFTIVALDGENTVLKEGDKIPVATGSFSTENSAAQTQFTYLDIGMNFNVTVNSDANGVVLKSKIEQSSVGQTSTIAGVTEPIVRQTVLEGLSAVTLDKPLMLGSIDVPNSTRHLDIDVSIEQVK